MNSIKILSEKRFSKREIFNMLIIVFLFLAAFNFVTRYYYWVYIAFALFIITPKRRMRVNVSTFYLLLFGLFMVCFDYESRASFTYMLKPFAYAIAYMIGMGMVPVNEEIKKKESVVKTIIALTTVGLFLHYLLNALTNMRSAERNTIDIWTKTTMSATAQSSLACLCVGVIIALFYINTSMRVKVFSAALMVFIIAYNLVLAGRTLLLMMILLALFAFILKCIYYKGGLVKGLLIMLTIVLILALIYRYDVFNIQTAFKNTNFYARFFGDTSETLTSDERLKFKLAHIKRMSDHPFGGCNIRYELGFYAHDLYLDTYDQAGIFSFVAIIAYMISSIARLFACLNKNNQLSFGMMQLIFCVYMAVNMQFFIEPILQGMPWLLTVYCLIDGAVTNYLVSMKERDNSLAQQN